MMFLPTMCLSTTTLFSRRFRQHLTFLRTTYCIPSTHARSGGSNDSPPSSHSPHSSPATPPPSAASHLPLRSSAVAPLLPLQLRSSAMLAGLARVGARLHRPLRLPLVGDVRGLLDSVVRARMSGGLLRWSLWWRFWRWEARNRASRYQSMCARRVWRI